MLFRYYFELIAGLIFISAILILGSKGTVVFVLLAALPLIMRINKTRIDERDLHVFYKAGNLTMGLMILFLILIYYSSDAVINGITVGSNWFQLSVGGFIFVHGLAGLITNYSN